MVSIDLSLFSKTEFIAIISCVGVYTGHYRYMVVLLIRCHYRLFNLVEWAEAVTVQEE